MCRMPQRKGSMIIGMDYNPSHARHGACTIHPRALRICWCDEFISARDVIGWRHAGGAVER
jgi:hypothetical protein